VPTKEQNDYKVKQQMKNRLTSAKNTKNPQGLQATYLSNSKQLEANLKSSIEES